MREKESSRRTERYCYLRRAPDYYESISRSDYRATRVPLYYTRPPVLARDGHDSCSHYATASLFLNGDRWCGERGRKRRSLKKKVTRPPPFSEREKLEAHITPGIVALYLSLTSGGRSYFIPHPLIFHDCALQEKRCASCYTRKFSGPPRYLLIALFTVTRACSQLLPESLALINYRGWGHVCARGGEQRSRWYSYRMPA